MKRIKIYCLVALTLLSLSVHAQNETELKTISGRVLSAATGNPLSGAIVKTAEVEGYSTLTAEDGTYEMKVPSHASSILISAPDFNILRRGISQKAQQADVSLYPSTMRKDYTPTTNVTATEQAQGFQYSSAINIEEEVQKNMGAYVHTTTRSGAPGIGSVMFMGGLNSLNSNAQPLVIIDGVIVDQQYGRLMLHDGF